MSYMLCKLYVLDLFVLSVELLIIIFLMLSLKGSCCFPKSSWSCGNSLSRKLKESVYNS